MDQDHPKTLADLAREALQQHRQDSTPKHRILQYGPPEEVLQQRGGWDQFSVDYRERHVRQDQPVQDETGNLDHDVPIYVTVSPTIACEIIKYLDSRPSLIVGREYTAQSLKDKLIEVEAGRNAHIAVDGETALLLCAVSDLLSFKLRDPHIREEFAILKINTARLSMRAMRFPSRHYEFTPISAKDVQIIRDTADRVLGFEGCELRDKVVGIFEAEVKQPERLIFPIIEEVAALERVVARNPQFWDDHLAQNLVKKIMSAAGRHVGLPLSSVEAQIITRAADLDTRGALDLLAIRSRHYAYWGRDERTFTKEDAQKLNRLASKIPQEKHLAAQIQSLTSSYSH